MIVEKMLKLLVLRGINNDAFEDTKFREYLNTHYNTKKMLSEYEKLGTEFLQEYALKTPRKSE